jgi:RHS repeat-associated protein
VNGSRGMPRPGPDSQTTVGAGQLSGTQPALNGARPTPAGGGAGDSRQSSPQNMSAPSGVLPGVAQAPTVSVPKGGGAVRGIGEKFSTNPVTGTAGLSIPLPLSPGRSGFTPALTLSYDSGAGQGIFGLGWTLGLPSITRKTDKGVPTYDERDVFILSGAEDLVRVTGRDGMPVPAHPRTVLGQQYSVVRYRPRVEGLYARIERWTREDGNVHWRSISRENVTTVYGSDETCRVSDPVDPPGGARRVFSWLIRESFDDKGNAVRYEYAGEDDAGVDHGQAHEQRRVRTANRYLKAVKYGNRVSHLVEPHLDVADWLFELVFDYGEGHYEDFPADPTPAAELQDRFARAASTTRGRWPVRPDPFSTYRAGFEVRTYRRCSRILMFHHIPDLPTGEKGYDGLVRSLEFAYADLEYMHPVSAEDEYAHQGSTRFGSSLRAVTQSGYVRDDTRPAVVCDGITYPTYLRVSLPPLELEYSKAAISSTVQTLDADSLKSLPAGLTGPGYQLVDLDGESIAGVLTEEAGGWYYTANLGDGQLGPTHLLPAQPTTPLGGGQLMDLAGDGQLDLVTFAGPTAGFFERAEGSWTVHRPFRSLPRLDWDDPNLRLLDLTGDGHADILITCGEALVWYPSLGEDGFGSGHRVPTPHDEDAGPRLVFADATGSVFTADLSGDGLGDLVRIRNGEVCYWPNLGHGRFGPRVLMDNAPVFDHPDRFDLRRLRLADVDGTGPTDLIYLGTERVDVYLNQMGNAWSPRHSLAAFPPIDDTSSVTVADLLGKGTAALVWSSPRPADAGRQVRYVDLMGLKPHLLTRVRNNLGAETVVGYSTSTAAYLADKAAGTPWVTRLPFPVHVVDTVETYDHINRARLVTRYRYHHGRFDGHEREFCGFALVEQEDTEQLAALARSVTLSAGDNTGPTGHVPPVLTRTWFHTGAYLDQAQISTYLAHSYYPPPEHAIPQALAWRLDDSVLDGVTTLGGEREACRALKGHPLRQEVYALDGTANQPHPYTVVEHNYTLRQLQPAHGDRHGVFAVDPHETVTATCERDPTDARVTHELVLDVDPDFGIVRHAVTVAYRRSAIPTDLPERTRTVQATTLVAETRTDLTTLVDGSAADTPGPGERDRYRAPAPYQVTVRQITGPTIDGANPRLTPTQLRQWLRQPGGLAQAGLTAALVSRQRVRFANDADPHTPLPFGTMGALGLVHESYTLVLPDDLVTSVYGTRVTAVDLRAVGYVAADNGWWAPSGTVRYTAAGTPPASGVAGHARRHFFLPRRFVDPFAATVGADYGPSVEYDAYDLLPVETVDAVGNRVTVGERNGADMRTRLAVDFRVLAPTLVTDPNLNQAAATYDVLGRITQTAIMGKPGDDTGDRVDPAAADLAPATLTTFRTTPRAAAAAVLGTATTRFVYDPDAYSRSRDQDSPQPTWMATLARERHVTAAPSGGSGPSPVQTGFAYADGFGREVQRKLPAEPDPPGPGTGLTAPRWVASGWVVLNNKGNPVRQYEPFFTTTHAFEFAVTVGVSPVLCYDPPGRVVATLHPNHTYAKVIQRPWQQTSWDVNDTAAAPDPTTDPDVGALLAVLPGGEVTPTWYQRRIHGDLGPREQQAAQRTQRHMDTPNRAVVDALGRPVLTITWNRTPTDGTTPEHDAWHRTYSVLDIAGRQLAVLDCPDDTAGPIAADRDRLVARYTHDLAGRPLLDESMEAGHRRILYDITGQPVTEWRPPHTTDPKHPDAEHRTDTTFDRLRRPLDTTLTHLGRQWLVERSTYGETSPDPATHNRKGRLWQVRDQAGLVTLNYDVEGNTTETTRTLAEQYWDTIDWRTATLEPTTWTTSTHFDALNRLTRQQHPDTTTVSFTYDTGGLLTAVHAHLSGQPTPQTFVRAIRYDPHGRRTLIDYGNGVRTTHTYQPDTFRLSRILTLRGAAKPPGGPYFPQDDEPVPPDIRRGVQDLTYTYDPVGNITNIRDAAQPRVFHLNTLVDASTDYTYDAIYRLVEASGREHLGQLANGSLRRPTSTSWNDVPRVNPADRNALGRYTERYVYDTAGNMTLLWHRGSSPRSPGWRREFTHGASSQLPQPSGDLFSNRLTSSRTGTSTAPDTSETYAYDTHGNMTVLPPMQSIAWNFRDQLAATTRQVTETGIPETTYYVYDAAAERVRKITNAHLSSPKRRSERLYLGDFEIYRRFDGSGFVTEFRESVHITDGEGRAALVETPRNPSDARPVVRYQLSNHLRSANGELDQEGDWISYEEYYPYGATALSFARSGSLPRRYRHAARERDGETGLSQHGVRYYAPWLARFSQCDPYGASESTNSYWMAMGNPIRYGDPSGLAPKDFVEVFHALGGRDPGATFKPRFDVSKWNSWVGRGLYASSSPTIPGNKMTNRTVFKLRISTAHMQILSAEQSAWAQVTEKGADLRKTIRGPMRYERSGGSEARNLRDYMKGIWKEGKNVIRIEHKGRPGEYTYVFRESALIGEPERVGVIDRRGRFIAKEASPKRAPVPTAATAKAESGAVQIEEERLTKAATQAPEPSERAELQKEIVDKAIPIIGVFTGRQENEATKIVNGLKGESGASAPPANQGEHVPAGYMKVYGSDQVVKVKPPLDKSPVFQGSEY